MSTLPLKRETAADPSPVMTERRRSVRRPFVVEAWLTPPDSTDPAERIEVSSANLSKHGIGFELPVKLAAGSFYIVEIGIGTQRMSAEVRITTSRDLGDGFWAVGAEFC